MDTKFYFLTPYDGHKKREVESEVAFTCLYFKPENCILNAIELNKSNNRYELIERATGSNNVLILRLQTHKASKFYKHGFLQESSDVLNDDFSLSNTFLNTLKYFIDEGFHIFLDRTSETDFAPQKLMKPYLERAKELNIDFNYITFLVNNYCYKEGSVEDWYGTPIKIMYFPYFLLAAHIASSYVDTVNFSYRDLTSYNRDKMFIIPIRKARLSRLLLLTQLEKLGYLEKSDWSFSSQTVGGYHNLVKDIPDVLSFLKKYDLDLNKNTYRTIDDVPDTTFNVPVNYYKNTLGGLEPFFNKHTALEFNHKENINNFTHFVDYKLWAKGKVHIVCESHVSGKYNSAVKPDIRMKNSIHITEKTYKPIRLATPFVLLGEQHMLKFLREFGFQTFDKHIDESYDDIELNYNTKLEYTPSVELTEKIDKVISAGVELEKIADSDEIREICKHNFDHIRNKEYFSYIFDNTFFKYLNELHRTTAAN